MSDPIKFEIPLSPTAGEHYAGFGSFFKASDPGIAYKNYVIYELCVDPHDLAGDNSSFVAFADQMLADMDAEWKPQADYFQLDTADSMLKYPDNVDRYNSYRLLQGLKEGRVALSIPLSPESGDALVAKAAEIEEGLFVNSGKKAEITEGGRVKKYNLYELNLDPNKITHAEQDFLNNEIVKPTRDAWAGAVDYAVELEDEDNSAGWAAAYDQLAADEQKEMARIIREQGGVDRKNYYAFAEFLSTYIPFSLPNDITEDMFPISQVDFTAAGGYTGLPPLSGDNTDLLFYEDGVMTKDTLLAYAETVADQDDLLDKLYKTVRFAHDLPQRRVEVMRGIAIAKEKGVYDKNEGMEPGDVIEGDQDRYTLSVANDGANGKNVVLTLAPQHFDYIGQANPLSEEWTRGAWVIHLDGDGIIDSINFTATDGGMDDIFSRVAKPDSKESLDGTAVDVIETEKLYFAPLVTWPWNGGASPLNTEMGAAYTKYDAYRELARVLKQISESGREANESLFLDHVTANLDILAEIGLRKGRQEQECDGDVAQYTYLDNPALNVVKIDEIDE